MMYVNIDADEKRVVQVSLALKEIPGKESADKVDAMKEQLVVARKCLDGVKRPRAAEGTLKSKIAPNAANEAAVLWACVALIRDAGKGEQLPDDAVLKAGITIYAPEIRAATRTLGAGGKWLAERAEMMATKGAKLAVEQESVRQQATEGEMKLGEAIHKLRELVSSALAYIHASSPPGSAARAHLKRTVHRQPKPDGAKKPGTKSKGTSKGESAPTEPPAPTPPPAPTVVVSKPLLITGESVLPAESTTNGASGPQTHA